MKKTLVFLLTLLPISLIAAVLLNTNNTNSVFADIFAVFKAENSHIIVNFEELEHDAKSITKIKFSGELFRSSPNNVFNFKIVDLDYDYLDKSNPRFEVSAELELDLIKAMGTQEVNEMAESLEEVAKMYTQDSLKEYGDAATASTKIVESKKDALGNYVSVKVKFQIDVDLSQLPAETEVSDVELTSLTSEISFTTQKTTLSLDVKLNPDYLGFDGETSGLKDELEKLVNRDLQSIESVQTGAAWLMGAIEDVLKKNNK